MGDNKSRGSGLVVFVSLTAFAVIDCRPTDNLGIDDSGPAEAGSDIPSHDDIGGDTVRDPCADHCRNGKQDCGETDIDCGGACQACAASEGDFFVDPQQGDDSSGDGSRASPFRSLPRARDAVRALRQGEPARAEPVVVILRGGTYGLQQTLALLAEDSGTADSPTIYRAFEGETPVISGGKVLSGWQVDQGRWKLTLPEVVSDKWAFTQLWVDGKRRQRPRLPKQKHYFIHRKAAPTGNDGKDDRFGFRADEIRGDWHNLSDVEVLAWHQWTISRHRIAAVDAASNVVTFTGPTHCDVTQCQLLPGYRYLVENVREALDEPGQWYLDSESGELTYLPLASEAPGAVEVIAARLPILLQLGGPGSDQTVQHVAFEGIAFAHTHWPTPQQGHSMPQSEVHLSAAIELRHASNCAFRRCSISHTGAWGLTIGDASSDNAIEGCQLTDLGAGGIHVGPADLSSGAKAAQKNLIRDNLIFAGGRKHAAGVGVLITNAAHTTVEHNDIADFYYTGISVGWNWGYSASTAVGNIIAHNHVHRIGQGVLSDMGGIYTLGISPGTHIHHNIFADIRRNAERYGGWGIYFDQASSDILAEFNLVYDTQDTPFHIHFGENNTLRNNIWIAENAPLMRRSKPEERHAVTVERNVFFREGGSDVQKGNWTDSRYTFENNIYWSSDGADLDFGGRSFADWQAENQDKGSLVADPQFTDPAKRDYSFAADSPAASLGIDPLDLSKTGRLSAPRSTEMAPVPRAFPAAEGTAPIDIDFEEMTVGQPPTVGSVHEGDNGGALRVTDTGAHGTNKSLLFTDAPGMTHSFNPHYTLATVHSEGTHQLKFSLRCSSGATVQLEWRDWRTTPYIIGPAIRIDPDGSIVVDAQILATINNGQWVDFEVTVKLGNTADGTFDLKLTPKGQAEQSFTSLPCGSADFDYLNWIGFISSSTNATTFLLDEITDATL